MDRTRRGYLARLAVVAGLLTSLAACSTSAATGTAPAGTTGTPSSMPTATPTLEPTPIPTVLPTPAPTGPVAWAIPCMETYTCSESGVDPIVVTWTASPSSVTNYSLYFTEGTYDFCSHTWTETGAATLVATMTSTQLSWTGSSPAVVGKYSVIAVSDGGLSLPVFSDPVTRVDNVMCP